MAAGSAGLGGAVPVPSQNIQQPVTAITFSAREK
jgi:hypothetical protein